MKIAGFCHFPPLPLRSIASYKYMSWSRYIKSTLCKGRPAVVQGGKYSPAVALTGLPWPYPFSAALYGQKKSASRFECTMHLIQSDAFVVTVHRRTKFLALLHWSSYSVICNRYAKVALIAIVNIHALLNSMAYWMCFWARGSRQLPLKRIDLVHLPGGLHQWDFFMTGILYCVYLTDVTNASNQLKRRPRKARLARKEQDNGRTRTQKAKPSSRRSCRYQVTYLSWRLSIGMWLMLSMTSLTAK